MGWSDGVLEPVPHLLPPLGGTGVGLGLGDLLPTPQLESWKLMSHLLVSPGL